MNLLRETREVLAEWGRDPEDIIFIGSETSGHHCTWAEFEVLADIEYNAGYGAQEVALDLIIVFKDGARLWRHEYDGSEGWTMVEPFKMPETLLPIAHLVGTSWPTLAELQEGAP